MDPKQVMEQTEIEENQGVLKSSHTKNPTTCKDVRRSGDACGICGSFNVVNQGVKYCETCGLEIEYLGESSRYWWSKNYESPICKCEYIKNKYNYKVSPRREYSILKCIDCGAVDHYKFCPNCRNKKGYSYNGTWKHWDGRIKCGICGFTIDNPVSCSIGAKPINAEGKQGTRKAKEKAKKHMSKRKRKRFEAKHKSHPNRVK